MFRPMYHCLGRCLLLVIIYTLHLYGGKGSSNPACRAHHGSNYYGLRLNTINYLALNYRSLFKYLAPSHLRLLCDDVSVVRKDSRAEVHECTTLDCSLYLPCEPDNLGRNRWSVLTHISASTIICVVTLLHARTSMHVCTYVY